MITCFYCNENTVELKEKDGAYLNGDSQEGEAEVWPYLIARIKSKQMDSYAAFRKVGEETVGICESCAQKEVELNEERNKKNDLIKEKNGRLKLFLGKPISIIGLLILGYYFTFLFGGEASTSQVKILLILLGIVSTISGALLFKQGIQFGPINKVRLGKLLMYGGPMLLGYCFLFLEGSIGKESIPYLVVGGGVLFIGGWLLKEGLEQVRYGSWIQNYNWDLYAADMAVRAFCQRTDKNPTNMYRFRAFFPENFVEDQAAPYSNLVYSGSEYKKPLSDKLKSQPTKQPNTAEKENRNSTDLTSTNLITEKKELPKVSKINDIQIGMSLKEVEEEINRRYFFHKVSKNLSAEGQIESWEIRDKDMLLLQIIIKDGKVSDIKK